MNASESDKTKAKLYFQFCQSELLRGLNGIDRPVASPIEAADLRRALMKAQSDCRELGVEIQTLWEFADQCKKEDEAEVRRFAKEQLGVTPFVTRGLRQKVAFVASLCVTTFVVSAFSLTGVSGLLLSLLASGVAFGIVFAVLAEVFPTPAIRVGRLACQKSVDVPDLWTESSPEAKDYELGFRGQLFRMNRNDEGGGLWAR